MNARMNARFSLILMICVLFATCVIITTECLHILEKKKALSLAKNYAGELLKYGEKWEKIPEKKEEGYKFFPIIISNNLVMTIVSNDSLNIDAYAMIEKKTPIVYYSKIIGRTLILRDDYGMTIKVAKQLFLKNISDFLRNTSDFQCPEEWIRYSIYFLVLQEKEGRTIVSIRCRQTKIEWCYLYIEEKKLWLRHPGEEATPIEIN